MLYSAHTICGCAVDFWVTSNRDSITLCTLHIFLVTCPFSVNYHSCERASILKDAFVNPVQLWFSFLPNWTPVKDIILESMGIISIL